MSMYYKNRRYILMQMNPTRRRQRCLKGNFDDTECGLIHRTTMLWNSNSYYDVELKVRDADGGFKTFFAHKLILAMAGKEFASMFYNNDDAPTVLKILDFSPDIIHMVLQYLYTDKLSPGNTKELYELFAVANKYSITDLVKECENYLCKEPITVDNLFVTYELAMVHNLHGMLQECRKFVCSETKSIINTQAFLGTTPEVIKDVLMQDMLNLDRELDLIYAVLRWCGRDCRRRGRPVDVLCLREAITPLLLHLRFLCLTAEEFCDLTEEYDILTSAESAVLTRKILMPNCNVRIPEGLCSITRQRGLITKNNDGNLNQPPIKEPINNNSKPSPEPIYSFQKFESSIKEPINNNPKPRLEPIYSSQKFENSIKEPINNNSKPSPEPIYSYQKSESPPKAETSNIFQFSSGIKKLESPQPSKADASNMFLFNSVRKAPPVLKVLPQSCGVQKFYDFPLQEMQKRITTVIENDIKCSATLKMIKGSILIHGIELRIAETKNSLDECIEVFSCITVNSQIKSNSHSLKLKNNMLSMPFPDPVRVSTYPVEIEITVENIKLNRCSICREQTCELNCGLSYAAEISLKSNQTNYGDYLFFLISRIIYSTY